MTLQNFRTRTLTALTLIFMVATACYLGDVYFLALICFISLAATRELHRLFVPLGLNVHREFLMTCVLLILIGAYAGSEYFTVSLAGSAAAVFALHILKGRKDISGYLNEAGMSLVLIAILGMMTGCAVLLRGIESPVSPEPGVFFLKNEIGFFFIVIAFLCGAANDSAAYFVGIWKGKRKIASGISPAKTFEGLIAGITAAVAGSMAVNFAFGSPFPPWLAPFFGLAAGISAIIGDLIESAIKRNGNVKDSGAMLPGHGGIFDRFDGIIFTFPTLYILVILFF